MVDQTSIKSGADRLPPGTDSPYRNGNSNGNGQGVVGRLTEFGNDVFTLAELQAKLASADFKDCTRRATLPAVALVVAAALAFAALPVALLGLSDLLARSLEITPGGAMLMTAGLALLIAGLIAAFFAGRLSASLTAFRRSQEEFTRNLTWVRTVVLHSRPPAR